MSLEQTLQENTAAMLKLSDQLAALVETGQIAPPANTDGAEAAGTDDTSAAAAATSTSKKKTSKKKSAKTTGAATQSSAAETAPSGEAVAYDDVKDRVLAIAKDQGRDAIEALLSRFGVSKAPDLTEAQYGEFVQVGDLVLSGIEVDEAVNQIRGG